MEPSDRDPHSMPPTGGSRISGRGGEGYVLQASELIKIGTCTASQKMLAYMGKNNFH